MAKKVESLGIRRKENEEKSENTVDTSQRSIRAAAYCRVSTAQELQEGSFETQAASFRKQMDRTSEILCVKIYGDRGSGLERKKRPQFQQMMQDCRDGKIGLIFCKSISRFGRNMPDVLESLRELKCLGVRVIFEKEGLDTADEQSELIFGILAAVAEEESRSIGENLQWGRKERLKKGSPYGTVSYGYRDRGKNHEWYPHEPEASRVRLAFQMALERQNYTQIRETLQKMEEDEKTGKKWNQSALGYLLSNPYYTGTYISNKTVEIIDVNKGRIRVRNEGFSGQFIIEGHHVPLVSRENFEKVQELIRRHVLFTPRNGGKILEASTDCERNCRRRKSETDFEKAACGCLLQSQHGF